MAKTNTPHKTEKYDISPAHYGEKTFAFMAKDKKNLYLMHKILKKRVGPLTTNYIVKN